MLRKTHSKSILGKLGQLMVALLLMVLLLHPSKAEEDSILSSASVPTPMFSSITPDANVFLHGSYKSNIRA